MKKVLRHGYTTGACAAAAARGAAVMLREQRLEAEAEIVLPGGERVAFLLHGQEFTENFAACFVVKDAGDDPDVTHGAEIHARITRTDDVGAQHAAPYGNRSGAACCAPTESLNRLIMIEGGIGVGRVTKPGLAVPVGQWAINPVPRRMIEEAVLAVFTDSPPFVLRVTISIPNGEQLAQKTLNSRLGIVGGLSILGTTGIVRPISTHAWTATIDAAIDVALACGCETIVLSTGRSSEMVAQRHLGLPEESYVMMGDHVGYALRACAGKGVRNIVIAGQFAKILKIACGHEQTHVSSSELDLRTLADWVKLETGDGVLEGFINNANTAREVVEGSAAPVLSSLVCTRARQFAARLAPGAGIKVLLAGYRGEVLYFA